MFASILRNRLIAAVKSKMNLPDFEILELTIENGKCRYAINKGIPMTRNIDGSELSELYNTAGITFDKLFLKITHTLIEGSYVTNDKTERFTL